ncbi:DUF4351 domain-containing protein [Candidatus Chloroploca asiatica]|uniref:DUF4351 domain-containing protein n=1 Tax=Candidatus Chloroploca asiatica TaxID=1506545 RepID=A0A2H3L3I1_9CHLR|nr:DUF4351 domain-containing protein [Candidatus Chloroploca asiatica]PDV96790.1 hypothetical protein A9Q02_06095 [Candidatus Chloroploca asiatica]
MAEQIIMRDYGLPETPMMRKLREQGREEGQFAVLLRLLERRCGVVPATLLNQVEQLYKDVTVVAVDPEVARSEPAGGGDLWERAPSKDAHAKTLTQRCAGRAGRAPLRENLCAFAP